MYENNCKTFTVEMEYLWERILRMSNCVVGCYGGVDSVYLYENT